MIRESSNSRIQFSCQADNSNRLANPVGSPGNCVHIPFNTGNCDCFYQARARYRCTDGRFSDWKFDVNIPTSCGNVRIANRDNFESFFIFPNPASDRLNLDYVPWEKGSVDITFLDMFGRVLKIAKQSVFEGDNSFSFDLEDFNSGMYIIQIRDGEEKYLRKFIVVK